MTKRSGLIAMLDREGWACRYCGSVLYVSEENGSNHGFFPGRATRDHIEPRHLGGRTINSNVIPACQPCNLMKTCFTLEQFLGQVERIHAHQQGKFHDET